MKQPPESPQNERPPTLLQTVASVLAAFFGVQSSGNRERDFQRGKPLVFILVGVFMTLALVGLIALLVHVLLNKAAAS